MKLQATDTIHVSSVKADNIVGGEEFEVGDAEGKSLVERGLAVMAGAAKAAPAARNKMAAPPANKAAAARRRKAK
jgi:hypothetical protein